jgi:hypothetical protein
MTNSNRRNNCIDSLLADGNVSTYLAEISEHIMQFYNNLYTEQFRWQPKLDGHSFDSVGETKANRLERVFVEEEVLEVVKAINSDKALGLDGYSMVFFQIYWDVLKEDIMKVFHDFHARGKFECYFHSSHSEDFRGC